MFLCKALSCIVALLSLLQPERVDAFFCKEKWKKDLEGKLQPGQILPGYKRAAPAQNGRREPGKEPERAEGQRLWLLTRHANSWLGLLGSPGPEGTHHVRKGLLGSSPLPNLCKVKCETGCTPKKSSWGWTDSGWQGCLLPTAGPGLCIAGILGNQPVSTA